MHAVLPEVLSSAAKKMAAPAPAPNAVLNCHRIRSSVSKNFRCWSMRVRSAAKRFWSMGRMRLFLALFVGTILRDALALVAVSDGQKATRRNLSEKLWMS